MAIDYVLATRCDAQTQLGLEQLVVLNRTRIQARSFIAHTRSEGDERPPSEIEIQLMVRSPDGTTGRKVTVQDMLDESRPLDEVAAACKTCPAGLPREFACHRRIRYPVPERVEQWLMSRLPEKLDCSAGALLVRGLGEFGWDGEPTKRLRAAGDTYFESKVPYGVRWENEDGRIEISSDQLFQMMFMVGNLEPTHCLMVVLFCGVIPHDTSLHDLKDEAGRKRVLAEANVPTQPDAEIEQFAHFLRTLAVAARLGVAVMIDG